MNVCLPRGGWPQATHSPDARSFDAKGVGLFVARLRVMADPNAEEFMARRILLIALVLSLGTANAAHAAPTPAASSSPASSPSPGAAPTPSAAQAQAPEQQLRTMVVTATRIEQPISQIGTTVTVVSGQQVEEQKIEHVSTALRQVPGVQVTQSGSPGTLTDVSIRGATPSQTLVLLDGVEVNTGATGEFNFANLTTDNLNRIEVLRGAGGSLYGSQAIGGVINVITPEGEGAPQMSLLSEGGNRATQRQVLTVSGAEGRLGVSGGLSYYSTEGFRPVNDNSDDLSGNIRLDYHLDDNTVVRGFARYYRANLSLSQYSVFSGIALDPTAHEREEFMLFNGEIEHHFGERLVVRANSYFVRDSLNINVTPFAGSPSSETDRIPDEIRGGTIESIYTWAQHYGKIADNFRTVGGFDFKDRWIRSFDGFFFPPGPASNTLFRARRQEYAGYLEQEGSFLDGHVLGTAGFRVDGNSQFGKEVSPSWSVAVPIEKLSTTLRGSYSEGFRAPSFDELYFPDFGNPNLRPEVSSEYDGGFTTSFGEYASLTATYFSRRVHDLIVTVPCPSCVFGSQAGNAGRVDVQGVEIAPAIRPVKGLTLGGSVTVLDETHDPGKSAAQPLRVPKHSAQALLQYVRSDLFLPHDRALANLAYTFVGDRDDITTASTIANHSAYSRFDLVVSYALGVPYGLIQNEEAFTRVENLLDRHYSEAFGFPAPPVNFVAGVKIDLR
jgi:vitamin B12 transporter